MNKKAKFFFRLDAIYGSRPNITPPLLYDQGSTPGTNSDQKILQLAEASCTASTTTINTELHNDRNGQLERMREVKKISGFKGKEKEKVKAPEFVDNTEEGKRSKASEQERQHKRKRMTDKESPVEKSLHSLSVEQALRAEKGLEFQQAKMTQEYDMRRGENKERKMQFQMEMDERRAEREERKAERDERKEEREIARQQTQEEREIHARSFDLQFKALEWKIRDRK